MRWLKDPKFENNLRKAGIVFDAETVNVCDIDAAEGMRRQKRLIAKLDQDYCIQLAMKMGEEQAAFPMILCQKPPRGKLWVWSGNHRFNGFLLAFPDAKVIECYTCCVKDPVMLDVLPVIVNAWESQLGYSKEERIANARFLIQTHGFSTAEAASMLGIKEQWIYVENAAQVSKTLTKDVLGADKLAKTILRRLHVLSDNTNALRETTRVICQYGVKGQEARQIIDDVRVQSTELQKMSELGRWEKILQQRSVPQTAPKTRVSSKAAANGHFKFTRSKREAILRNLTGLAKSLQGVETLAQAQLTDPADLAVVERCWNVVLSAMNKLKESK